MRKKDRSLGYMLRFLSILVALGTGVGSAQGQTSERRSISVLSDDNYAPYVFRASDGTLQGIVVDLWKAWEKSTGISVELQALSWAQAQQSFNQGKADVLDTVFITEERKNIYSFTEPYARIEVPIFTHKTISGIANVDGLRGFKVAVKEGDAAITELTRAGITDLATYESYEAIVEAAARGDIKIFCIDAPPAFYYLNRRGIEADFRLAFILNEGAFHRAVLKGNEDILKLVEDGFKRLSPSALSAIERTWLGSSIPRIINLRVMGLVAAIVVALVGFLLVTSGILKRRVNRATIDLNDKVRLLEASEAKNRAFIAVLPDLFFTIGADYRFIEFNTSRLDLLALPPEAFLGKRIDEVGFPHESVELLKEGMRKAFAESRMMIYEYSLELNSEITSYEGRIVPISASRVLLLVRDITENRKREDRLHVSLLEKEILLKEIHHRVKNNMQIISSLIQLQSYSIRDETDGEMLRETQSRIRAMATVHELLYESQDFSSIDASRYLESIVEEIAIGYDAANVRCAVESLRLDIDEAVPLGLIANELIINAIKYAYEQGSSEIIQVELRQEVAETVFSVADKGKGLPCSVDPWTTGSMGLTLVRSLASQLKGSLVFDKNSGFRATLRFRRDRQYDKTVGSAGHNR